MVVEPSPADGARAQRGGAARERKGSRRSATAGEPIVSGRASPAKSASGSAPRSTPRRPALPKRRAATLCSLGHTRESIESAYHTSKGRPCLETTAGVSGRAPAGHASASGCSSSRPACLHSLQLWEAGEIEFDRPVISPHLPRSETRTHAFPARRGYMFRRVSAASLASSSYSKERRCIPRH
jgi:hypothetical protein